MITSTKHILINGKEQLITEDYKLIQKKDRAGSNGKNIKCPVCEKTTRIGHLAFSTFDCPHCNQRIDKYDWMIDQLDTWRTPK
tara:strand:- start:159 stop:407 length:249 start_codon:yes stop_codon:yes gene_type:complete